MCQLSGLIPVRRRPGCYWMNNMERDAWALGFEGTRRVNRTGTDTTG